MWLKELVKDPEITQENPFNEDTMGREQNIKLLTEHLTSGDSPNVISLNGGWGSGKTVFVMMWKAYLESQNYVALYFNAWDCDFSDDPLVPFLARIGNQIKEVVPSLKNKETKKMIEAGKAFLKTGFFNAAKIASSGIVDLKIIDESLVDQQFKVFSDREKEIANFKKALSDLIKAMGKLRKNKKKTPIFIFVDELDRCKPSFAIRLLERIKHLFNVNGFVFVLSIAGEQLGHSVKAVYGSDFDARGYLRRFFDYEYVLPEEIEVNIKTWAADTFKKAQQLSQTRLFSDISQANLPVLFSDFSRIFQAKGRDQRQILQQFFFLVNPLGSPQILLLLLFLQRFDPILFDEWGNARFADNAQNIVWNIFRNGNPNLWDYLDTPGNEKNNYQLPLGKQLQTIILENVERQTRHIEKNLLEKIASADRSIISQLKPESNVLTFLNRIKTATIGEPREVAIKGMDFYFNRIELGDGSGDGLIFTSAEEANK